MYICSDGNRIAECTSPRIDKFYTTPNKAVITLEFTIFERLDKAKLFDIFNNGFTIYDEVEDRVVYTIQPNTLYKIKIQHNQYVSQTITLTLLKGE
jgi:hypothetical protein